MSSSPSGTKILAALALLGGAFMLAWSFHLDGPRGSEPPREAVNGPVLRETPAPSEAFVVRPDAPTAEIQPTLLAPPPDGLQEPEPIERQYARLAPPPMLARSYPSVSPQPRYGASGGLAVQLSARDPLRRTHKVRDGDTLEKLAERYLGEAARWREIFAVNGDVIERPDLLPVGARLEIPPNLPREEPSRTDEPALTIRRAPLVRVDP